MSKPVLGRGLASLIPQDQHPLPRPQGPQDDGTREEVVAIVDLDKIQGNPFQPRAEFDPASLEELKHSIQEKGVIQPITVRRADQGYQLISGERRVRAAREAGLRQIPAYIIRVNTNEEMLELALIENLQREDLNPIEVAVSYRRLIEECSLTQEQVSQRVGKDRTTVTNTLRLLKLPEEIQNAVRQGKISGGHARALLAVEEEPKQLALFQRAIARDLSVRALEKLVGSAGRIKPRAGSTAPAQEAGTRSAVESIEEKLRQLLGTKVTVRTAQDGRGEIVIEYYSADDLGRLLDMFDELQSRAH
ncbi:MAG TPA: ParB/RepB/Spo0J family partition protein [Bacteroidota bacterium]